MLVCLFDRLLLNFWFVYSSVRTPESRRCFPAGNYVCSRSRGLVYKDDVTGNVIVGAELGVGVGSHLTALVLILYSGK